MPSLRRRKHQARRSRRTTLKRGDRSTRSSRSHRRTPTGRRSRRRLGGGEAIASGAYGCVFKPALRCSGETSRPAAAARLVTKLGRASDLADEFLTLQQVRATLETIPNFRDYFVIDSVTACTPAPLEDDDLRRFNDVCHNFTHPPASVRVLDASSVNQNLELLSALTMPDGGQDLLEVLLSGGGLSAVEFQRLNLKLIELLGEGIVPMNTAGLVHGDVKLENVVAEVRLSADGARVFERVRLIDWGSSVSGVNETPAALMGRPSKTGRFFINNLPPGSVFLHEDPVVLDRTLARASSSPTPRALTEYYYDGLVSHITATNPSQARVETEKITTLTDFISKAPSVRAMMFPHLMTIISQFYVRADKHLDVERYVRTVYVKNCDVWGLLSVYGSLLTGGLDFEPPAAFTALAQTILNRFMYGVHYAAKPIDVPELVRHLLALNTYVVVDVDEARNTARKREREGEGDGEGDGDGVSKQQRSAGADL